MASSLISINDATTEALCQLEHIGPRRAERIIRYREQIGPIETIDQLAEAADLSIQQAINISGRLSLSARRSPRLLDLSLTGLFLFASAAYLSLDILDTGLGLASPGEITFNVSLLSIVVGCLIAIVNSIALRRPLLTLIASSLWASGVMLGTALAFSIVLSGREDEFSTHVLSAWRLSVYAVAVVTLQFLPGLLLDLIPRGIRQARQIFDACLLPVAILLVVIVTTTNSDQWIEEIFAVWAGVIFLQHGFTMVRGDSAFYTPLSDKQRARLRFLATEDDIEGAMMRGRHWRGVTLMLIGMVFLGLAAGSLASLS